MGEPIVAEFADDKGDARTWTQSELDMQLACIHSKAKRDKFLALVRRNRVFDDGWRSATRTRRDENLLNDQKKKFILAELTRHGNLTLASDAAGFSVVTVRKHMERDVDFSQAIQDRMDVYSAEVSTDIVDSARHGHLEQRWAIDTKGERYLESSKRIFETKIRERVLVRNDPSYREQKEVENKFSGGVVLLPGVATAEAWAPHYDKLRAAQREKALEAQAAEALLAPPPAEPVPIETTGESAG